MRLLPIDRRWRRATIAGYAFAVLLAAALLLIAAFPIGLLKPTIEQRLSARFGRAVTIASIERRDMFSLTPTILVRGARVPQSAWAGRGDLARIEQAELTIATLPLLRGRVEPTAIVLRGAHLSLVRAKDGRENWHADDQRDSPSRRTPVIERLTIADSSLSYRDAKRDRRIAVTLSSDANRGLIADGHGVVRGSPVTIAFRGGAIGRESGAAWPFRARIDGADLTMSAKGSMASPLDTDRMALEVRARATDLKYIDAIIEAGLFDTQPVRLTAHVEHDAPTWKITKLKGTIGRSTLAGHLDVTKHNGRTRIDGAFDSGVLDPSDLSSDAGIARGAALEREIGPRLVPNARIDIGKIDRTDGRLDFRIARVVGRRGESSIRGARGSVTMDRQLMTIAPLRIAMKQGAITGRIVVDQRGDVPVPTVTMDVRLKGSSIGAIAGGGGSVTGRLDARVHLIGKGETIRAAVGRSDGRIGLAARDGSLPERIADVLGFDAGRALFAGRKNRAGLRCVILELDVRGGRGRIAPLVVDTTESQLDGQGSITFPGETLAIRLTGAPKRGSVLRLPGSASMTGTISLPDLGVPREVKSVGNIFRAIGRAITGRQGAEATDANCVGMAAHALR